MDVKVSIGEEVVMNTPIKVEVRKDKGGTSLNNASATERSAEQRYPAKVYEAARKLADVIKGANVKDIISTIETLACQADSIAVFNFRRLSRGSLLHIAAATGESNIVRLLLERVDAHLIAARDDWGNTPLHLATKFKAIGAINMLIFRAKDLPDVEDRLLLRKKNNYGNTALHEAVLARDVDLVSHLLGEDSEPVYWKNKDQKSPLYLAIDIGNSKILEVLLSKSLDPSKIQGLPPVLGAVARKQYDLLGQILRKDTKLFAMRDSGGGNVFHLAAFWNVPEVFKFLQPETEYLAQEQDNNGDLPIHIASKRGHVELINKLHLVSKWVNGKGQTVLHVAAKYGREEVVRYILKHRDLREMINERDDDGNTASHLAVKNLHLTALMHLVLDEEMDPYLLNHEGLAAVDIAGLSSQTGLRRGLARFLLLSVSYDRSDRIISKPEARDKWHPHGLLPTKEADDVINTMLVVATLVASVSFTAGFAVPGGLNGSDLASKDDQGMATLLDNRKFQAFVICNTVAMLCSMASVIGFLFTYLTEIHISIFGCHLAGLLLAISLPPTSAAFLIGVILTIEKLPWLAIVMVILGSIFVLVITAALVSPFVAIILSWLPRFRKKHLRPIRPLISSLFRVYMILFRIERTFISDDSKVHRTASKTSTSPPDGDAED
ncbi:protein ACCELERATED CELL DEATH 6 [Eucalyptus grandis]|uniref:protein ACCELERATED CELL DEATH 6 n=1 Tax=Eucalyptus grandis TaxID=71139 RepID=UPI00192EC105|nr:protein ACCELERATED CELL DEATH 6 [Eucalyptus grandis]